MVTEIVGTEIAATGMNLSSCLFKLWQGLFNGLLVFQTWDKEMLAKQVLAEIPQQVVQWMSMRKIQPGAAAVYH